MTALARRLEFWVLANPDEVEALLENDFRPEPVAQLDDRCLICINGLISKAI